MYDKQDRNVRVYKGLSIERKDPFGFWVIDSNVPELKQSFTMISMAVNAIDSYLTKSENKDRREVSRKDK